MPKTKTTSAIQPPTKKQLEAFRLAHINIQTDASPEAIGEDFTSFIRVPVDAEFSFNWEFSTPSGDGEFVRVTFRGEELLRMAVELGKLTESTSGERRVPIGKLPATRESKVRKVAA